MKKRVLLLLGLVLVVLVLGVFFSPSRLIVLGWISGEDFHAGWPVSYWLEALDNPDPNIRRQAVSDLAHAPPSPKVEKLIPALIRALEDKNPLIRWGAASALGEIGQCPEQVIPALVRMLDNESSSERGSAISGLGLFGPPAHSAVPKLADALNDESPGIRKQAAWALGRIGPRAKTAVPDLLKRVDDNEAAPTEPFITTVGDMACAAIWAIDPDAATEAGIPQVYFPWDRFGKDRNRLENPSPFAKRL